MLRKQIPENGYLVYDCYHVPANEEDGWGFFDNKEEAMKFINEESKFMDQFALFSYKFIPLFDINGKILIEEDN